MEDRPLADLEQEGCLLCLSLGHTYPLRVFRGADAPRNNAEFLTSLPTTRNPYTFA